MPGTSPQASDVTLWLNALQVKHEIDKPGPEWKSVEQLHEMLNCSLISAKRYAAKAVKRGTLEKKMFTCLRSNNTRIKRPFFKLV